jgi:hypothetical protein
MHQLQQLANTRGVKDLDQKFPSVFFFFFLKIFERPMVMKLQSAILSLQMSTDVVDSGSSKPGLAWMQEGHSSSWKLYRFVLYPAP